MLHAPAVEAARERIRARKEPAPSRLSDEQVASFQRDGFICLRAAEMWTVEEFDALISGVDLMDPWPERKATRVSVCFVFCLNTFCTALWVCVRVFCRTARACCAGHHAVYTPCVHAFSLATRRLLRVGRVPEVL